MLKIDVHNHFYPEAYIAAVSEESRAARLESTADGRTLIHYAGDYSVIVEAHRDPRRRVEDLDRASVDMQILSLTVPGVHYEEPQRGIDLARVTNNAFAEICRQYPERFRAFATLPTQSPVEAAGELERAVSELGLVGAMIFSNLGGRSLDDERFWPIYEAAEGLDVPLLVHPFAPPALDNFQDLRMVPLVGFPMDVTVAATRLVLSGTIDRFPRLTFIMSQLGGALPMLAERVDRGAEIYPELAGKLQRKPSDYFRDFYYDTVPYGSTGTPLTYAFAGPERILLASDHPHQIGSLDDCATVIEAMEIPESHKRQMLSANAERLFGITKES